MIRTLLVDDLEDLLFIAYKFLEKQAPDIEVVTCDSAKDALKKLEEDAFDIIVSDYQMPEMDGLEFLEIVRKSGNEVPFIIFTGRGREEVAIQALNLGATHYLKKGGEQRSQFAELAHHIRTAVSHRKSEIALHESEGRYRSLFWDSAVSMWEEDFSDVKKFFDEKRAEGITNFREYFENHPEDVEKCVGLVIVNDVNRASIELQNVKEKQDLIGPLKRVFHKDGLGVFKEQLIALAEGNNLFKSDIYQVRDFIGQEHVFIFQLSIPPGYEKTLAKVYLSIIDVTEKSESEILAQQESKKAQIYLELSSVLFVALDNVGRVDFVNSHTCSILGYKEEELIGKDWFDIAIPDNMQTLDREFFSELIAGKTDSVHYHENTIKTRFGEERVISWHKTCLTDELGNVTGILCSGEDITDRRLMNEALQESKERYRLVLNTMKELIFVCDKGDCYTQMYASDESMLIPPKDIIIGKHVSERMLPHLLKLYLENSKIVRETGESRQFDYSLELEGKEKWFSSTLSLHDDEECIISVSHDITERKLAEENLLKSEKMFRVLADSMAVGILVVNRVGFIEYTNASFAKMWNIPRETLETMDEVTLLETVINKLEDPDEIRDKVNDIIGSSEERFATFRFKDGRTFEAHSRPLFVGKKDSKRVWIYDEIIDNSHLEH